MKLKDRNVYDYGISVGSSTLIMIFALLCLVVFSLLTYNTALNEKKLSEKISDEKRMYYDADYSAVQIKREIEKNLNSGKSIEKLATTTNKNGGTYIGYDVRITDTKKLSVELKKEGKKLKVVKWVEVNEATENYNNYLNLWGGTK